MPPAPCLLLVLVHSVLIQATFVAARQQQKHFGGLQQRAGPDLLNHAKITLSSHRRILDSYVVQARGGSDYPEEKDYGDYKYGAYRDDYSDDRRGSDIFDEYDDRGKSPSSVSFPATILLEWV
jgi:hypothetical protein